MTISKKGLYFEVFFACFRSVDYLLSNLCAPISDGQILELFRKAFMNFPDVDVVSVPRVPCQYQSVLYLHLFYKKSKHAVPGCVCSFSERPLNNPVSCL